MGHTPGPWTVEDRRNAPLKNIRVVVRTHEVCQVSDVHQRDYQGNFTGDHKAADALDAVGLANARLIAAAPDLLAACKELDEAIRCYPCYCTSGFKCSRCKSAAIGQAAIRNATGLAPEKSST
jgi:hypothetical protein